MPYIPKFLQNALFGLLILSLALEAQAHTLMPSEQHPQQQERVVLVHGLMRTYQSMGPLKLFLEKQGYKVYNYSYPSPKYSIHEHSLRFNRYIQNILAKSTNIKVHFVTHSLGGIIAREALSMLSSDQLKNIGYLVMLAPPNQGSDLANLFTHLVPFIRFSIKPLNELSSNESAYVHQVPIPKIKMGIIAGRFDSKVPPSSARLDGQNEPEVVNSNHSFIMMNSKAKQLVLNFLETGTFK